MAAGAFLHVTAIDLCERVPDACKPRLDEPHGSGETEANKIIFNMLDSRMSERATDLTQLGIRWGVFGVMVSSLSAFRAENPTLHDVYMKKVSYAKRRDGRAKLSETFALALVNMLLTREDASGFHGSHMSLIERVLGGNLVPSVSKELEEALEALIKSATPLPQIFVFRNIVTPAYMFAISASISLNDSYSKRVSQAVQSLVRLARCIHERRYDDVQVFESVFDSILQAPVHDIVMIDFKLLEDEINSWNRSMARIAEEVDKYRSTLDAKPVKSYNPGDL